MESIIEKGYISKPYIGISMSDVSKEYQIYGLPQGTAVQSVTEGSPAEEAGLQVGDIITAVDGKEITGYSDLKAVVGASDIGDELHMTVYRQGTTVEITVVVGEQIQSALEEEQTQQNTQNNYPWGSNGKH